MVSKMTVKPIKFTFVNEKAKEQGGSQVHETLKICEPEEERA